MYMLIYKIINFNIFWRTNWYLSMQGINMNDKKINTRKVEKKVYTKTGDEFAFLVQNSADEDSTRNQTQGMFFLSIESHGATVEDRKSWCGLATAGRRRKVSVAL